MTGGGFFRHVLYDGGSNTVHSEYSLYSLFRRVILYRQVNNKPHVQIKRTKDHAKSYAAYQGMTLKKPETEVAR